MSQVWIGDAVRALSALDAFDSNERFDMVVELLGLGTRVTAEEPLHLANTPQTEHARRSLDSEPSDTNANDPEPISVDVLAPVDDLPVPQAGMDAPPLPEPGPLVGREALCLEPLLGPTTTRSLLQLILSRNLHDGDVDIAGVVSHLAKGLPPDDLPRLPQRTLRFGVQLLLDVGEGMALFRRDQAQLTESVRAVAGHVLTRVMYFADIPTRGCGPLRRSSWRPYRPPPAGTRVLIVSDFGQGGSRDRLSAAKASEWLSFVELLDRSGSQPLALSPYPQSRFPHQLVERMPFALWDRSLTAFTAAWAAR